MPSTTKRTRTSSPSSKSSENARKKNRNSTVSHGLSSSPNRKDSGNSDKSRDSAICMSRKHEAMQEHPLSVTLYGIDPAFAPNAAEAVPQRNIYNPASKRQLVAPSGHPLVTKQIPNTPRDVSQKSAVQTATVRESSFLGRDWERSRTAQWKATPHKPTTMQHQRFEPEAQLQFKLRNSGYQMRDAHNNVQQVVDHRYDPTGNADFGDEECAEDMYTKRPLVIEHIRLVTLPRTMEDDDADQVYDTFEQGVAMHTNNLRYHVRVLKREDVGREEYQYNSGNYWRQN